ncbi:hypothetical protein HDA32_005011 [Spinactinospora alkalitolerans]|uniref:Uncharacterized protein n=1 Tax=Spinactinospora alkalitolerans TaxID=687207 RepID=A0A852U191_9ACTN|nr:hypothetical protein [Spinactinospora alkalitolerans]NYE49891.1 hypothetical protein [Spinactinospora alkalitolerans]
MERDSQGSDLLCRRHCAHRDSRPPARTRSSDIGQTPPLRFLVLAGACGGAAVTYLVLRRRRPDGPTVLADVPDLRTDPDGGADTTREGSEWR